jgi:hypothetical protein
MKIQVVKCSIPGAWYENCKFPFIDVVIEDFLGGEPRYICTSNSSKIYAISDCINMDEEDNMAGKKHDQGKLRYDLYPVKAYEGCTAVLTFGAKKYTPHGWKTVPDPVNRYYAALIRHLNAQKEYIENGGKGLSLDEESGLPHLDHAQCCLVFLRELS